ncbi:hypothetical protein TNCV_81511 [Trichonephila clavipes]|nr:hypothetical protein TNCV_81511 [Trichonephila clavipes]
MGVLPGGGGGGDKAVRGDNREWGGQGRYGGFCIVVEIRWEWVMGVLHSGADGVVLDVGLEKGLRGV